MKNSIAQHVVTLSGLFAMIVVIGSAQAQVVINHHPVGQEAVRLRIQDAQAIQIAPSHPNRAASAQRIESNPKRLDFGSIKGIESIGAIGAPGPIAEIGEIVSPADPAEVRLGEHAPSPPDVFTNDKEDSATSETSTSRNRSRPSLVIIRR